MVAYKKGMAVLCSVLSVTCMGCSLFPDGKTYQEGQVEVETQTDAKGNVSARLNDGVSVDAKTYVPEHAQWKNYTVHFRDWTEEQIASVQDYFANGKSVADVKKSTGDKEYTNIIFSDGASLSFMNTSSSFGYSTKKDTERQYDSYIRAGGEAIRGDIQEVFPLQEIEGLSRTQAVQTVKDACDKLNIHLEDTPEVYAIDAQHAQKLYESDELYRVDKHGDPNPAWTTEDEAYAVYYRVVQDGVRITNGSYQIDTRHGEASYVRAIVGRDGLLSLRARAVYDVTAQTDVTEDFCTMSDVMKILAARYYYTQGNTAGTQIQGISLEYAPIYTDTNNEYTLKPYWVCKLCKEIRTIKDGQEITYSQIKNIFIDAVNQTVLGG